MSQFLRYNAVGCSVTISLSLQILLLFSSVIRAVDYVVLVRSLDKIYTR